MTNDESLEEARRDVWAENTAQAVHKHLNKLFQESARFRSRWIWELLQNARDASPNDGINVSLVHQMDRLIFRHSGLPFTHKSIAHLIYHGSTKYDFSEASPIGQFGTGFLTTHLISKTVIVRGTTDDQKEFQFLLDRRGDNADQLKVVMNSSWEEFKKSLVESAMDGSKDFTTEYEYPISGSSVNNMIVDGIQELITNAAYLLAFNEKIRSVQVIEQDRALKIEKVENQIYAENVHHFRIHEQTAGGEAVSRYLFIMSSDGNAVAVEMKRDNSIWSVIEEKTTPRIFIAFPLTGTRDFAIPIVFNNEKLQPREERDTLFLGPDSEGKQSQNMIMMEQAFDLAARLAILGMRDGWNGAVVLSKLNRIRQCDWIDEDWFCRQLVERFIQPIRGAEVLTTHLGSRIAPAASLIPLSADFELCSDLWDIAVQINSMTGQLPRRDDILAWSENQQSWLSLLSKYGEQQREILTIEKICERVAIWGSVAEIKKQLTESSDPIAWLNQLHLHINKVSLTGLFDKLRLIPSQSGDLKKLNELRQDQGIDEELKDIAQCLGLKTRDELLDLRIQLTTFLEIKPKMESEVLSEALQCLKAKIKSYNHEIGNIAVRFFAWVVRHNKMDLLEGFPVLTREAADGNVTIAMLFRDPDKFDELLLAPVPLWPEEARLVADLFPKRQTLSDDYYNELEDNELWEDLKTEAYIRLSPLYNTKRRVPFIPDEPLPVSDKEKKFKHRTKDAVDVSALAFFEKDDTGLDAVRRSKTRAVKLLSFIAGHVLEKDLTSLDMIEGDCECGEQHRYYRAAWLVPMWERQWVPLGDNKQASATAETIAQLFNGRESELRQITSGDGRRLLEALGISLADLSLRAVAKDEETRISLMDSLTDIVHAAANDAEKVKLLAEEIKHSPFILDEIEKHRERREKVRRNQIFGAEVENLLKEALESYGLKVTRTGVGSDYEIEEDYVIDDEEVVLSVTDGRKSYLIEVKATVSNDARMTKKQAETSVTEKDRFILCMIRLDSREATPDLVRAQCRFIMDIGRQIEPVWNEYNRYLDTREEVCSRVGEVELIVQESDVRFAVGKGAWENGLNFCDAIEVMKQIGK